jgi:hypothetical protein
MSEEQYNNNIAEGPYHEWGSEFDWKSLGKACRFFSTYLRLVGRIQMIGTKEKYGTMRLEWFVWNGHYNELLHAMIYPGQLFIRWPVWMRRIDKVITAFCAKIGICKLISVYQRFIFNIVTLIAVKRWPHIRYEIMDELEFRDLLYSWVKKKTKYICHWTDVP